MKKRSPLHIVDKLYMYKSHLESIYLIYNRMNRTFTTQKQLTLLLLFKLIFQAVQTVNSTVVVAVQDPGLISQGITSWARRASSSPYILFHWIKSLVIAVLAENFLFFVPSGPNIKKKKKPKWIQLRFIYYKTENGSKISRRHPKNNNTTVFCLS